MCVLGGGLQILLECAQNNVSLEEVGTLGLGQGGSYFQVYSIGAAACVCSGGMGVGEGGVILSRAYLLCSSLPWYFYFFGFVVVVVVAIFFPLFFWRGGCCFFFSDVSYVNQLINIYNFISLTSCSTL